MSENKKYTYIILWECISFKDKENNFKIIDKAKSHVENDGSILLITQNLANMKFLSEVNYNNYDLDGMTRNDLKELMSESGINNYRFYYPFPSHKNSNAIFTDDLYPDLNSLHRYIDFKLDVEYRNFNDRLILRKLITCDKKYFKDFCNSYVVEISPNLNKIKALYYNNTRKNEFKFLTKIYEDNVIKTYRDESVDHFKNVCGNIDLLNKIGINTLDSYDDDKIVSKYVKDGTTIQDIIMQNIESNSDAVQDVINKYTEEILYKLQIIEASDDTAFEKYEIDVDVDKKKKLHFVQHGLFDLIFQNIFVIDNEFYVYDQEWIEPKIPLEFILYRSILYMSSFSAEEKNSFYEKLNLKDYINEFSLLESKIPEQILDKEVFEAYINSEKSYSDVNSYISKEINKKNDEITKLERDIKHLKKEINHLKRENETQEKKLKEQNLELHNDLYKTKVSETNLLNLVYEKEKNIIEKEKRIADLDAIVDYYNNLKVVKLGKMTKKIYRKIKRKNG